MAGIQVTFVYIVQVKNGLHAYSCFVDNTLGVCSEHEGSNGRDVKGRRRFSMGGMGKEKKDGWECLVYFQVQHNGVR